MLYSDKFDVDEMVRNRISNSLDVLEYSFDYHSIKYEKKQKSLIKLLYLNYDEYRKIYLIGKERRFL